MTKTIDGIGMFLNKIKISKRTLAIVFVLLFILSLIPIVITAFYSVPIGDDYNYGLRAHMALKNGESFMSGVFESCDFFYNNWQGFFTANFLASIQPFNIDINLYWISNIVALISICFGLFYFSKVILIDVMKSSISDYLLISIPFVSVFIQFMPGIQQAVYWMDGSLSMIANMAMLCVLSFIIKYHYALKTNKKTKLIYFILAIVISALFSGMSPLIFVTLFLVSIASIIYCLKNRDKTWVLIVAVLIVYAIGLTICIIAPGNAKRMASVDGLPLLNAIFKASYLSVYFMGEWSTLFYFAFILFVSVIFYPIAQKSPYKFNRPLLVFIFCYTVYAARFSVQLFATGSIGALRQLNEYYLGFIVCITISVLYFVGYLSKNKLEKNNILKDSKISLATLVVISFLFISGTVFYCYNNTVTSISTALSFVKGETQTYNIEMKERIEMYQSDSTGGIEVEPLSVYPSFFMQETIMTDKEYWANKSTARYFEKEYVVMKE